MNTEMKSKKQLQEIKEKIQSFTKYKVKGIQCVKQNDKWVIEIQLENYKNKFQIESIKNEIMLNLMLHEVYKEVEQNT